MAGTGGNARGVRRSRGLSAQHVRRTWRVRSPVPARLLRGHGPLVPRLDAWLAVHYEPDSKSFHKISVTMVRRLGEGGKLRLLYRNHILFTVKNVGGAPSCRIPGAAADACAEAAATRRPRPACRLSARAAVDAARVGGPVQAHVAGARRGAFQSGPPGCRRSSDDQPARCCRADSMTTIIECPGCGGQRFRPSRSRSRPSAGATCISHRPAVSTRSVFSNPMAEPAELERFYGSSYYEDHEIEFNPSRPDLEDVIRARGRREAEDCAAQCCRIRRAGFFEIGAGFGGMLDGARQLGFEVAGVEPSEQAARFGREVMGLSGLRHGLFDARDWPAACCDVMYSYMVIDTFRPAPVRRRHLRIVETRRNRGDRDRESSQCLGRASSAAQLVERPAAPRIPDRDPSHVLFFRPEPVAADDQARARMIRCWVYTPSLADKLPRIDFAAGDRSSRFTRCTTPMC